MALRNAQPQYTQFSTKGGERIPQSTCHPLSSASERAQGRSNYPSEQLHASPAPPKDAPRRKPRAGVCHGLYCGGRTDAVSVTFLPL